MHSRGFAHPRSRRCITQFMPKPLSPLDDSSARSPPSTTTTTALRSPSSPGVPRMRGNYHKLSILSRVTGGGSGPPSSGLYERLENGGPDGDRKRSKFAAWKKFAIGAAVLIFIVWLVGPRERRARLFGTDKGECTCTSSGSILNRRRLCRLADATREGPGAPRWV